MVILGLQLNGFSTTAVMYLGWLTSLVNRTKGFTDALPKIASGGMNLHEMCTLLYFVSQTRISRLRQGREIHDQFFSYLVHFNCKTSNFCVLIWKRFTLLHMFKVSVNKIWSVPKSEGVIIGKASWRVLTFSEGFRSGSRFAYFCLYRVLHYTTKGNFWRIYQNV